MQKMCIQKPFIQMKIIECDKEHKEKWNNAIYNRNYYIELS